VKVIFVALFSVASHAHGGNKNTPGVHDTNKVKVGGKNVLQKVGPRLARASN
jgi:hypothetical protein